MEKIFGLWVNHEKAIIVSLMGRRHKVIRVESDIEGHFRLKGGSRSKTPVSYTHLTLPTKRIV